MALIDRWREHMAKAVKTLPFCRMHGVHLTVSVAARQHSHAMGKPESGAGNPDPITGNSCLFSGDRLAKHAGSALLSPELLARLVWPWQVMFENRGPKRVFRIHHVSEPDSTGLGQ